MSAQTDLHTGKLLLATPFLYEPHFRRAVVLLTEHAHYGTHGFILNKLLKDIKVSDLLSYLPDFDAPLYYGGPVATDTIHFIHSVGELLEGSQFVAKGIWWGGDFEKMRVLVNNNVITSEQIRFFLGYSGWSEGQLEAEYEDGTWITHDSDLNYVFQSKTNNLWKRVLQNKGNAYEIIADIPETNMLN